jgi:p-hydroxybenzoate 3-monooxygenase
VYDSGRHDQQCRRLKRIPFGFRLHLTAAREDDEQLVQVAMGVRLDPPIVDPAAIGNRLDVQKALIRIPRRLAVQEESRNDRLSLSHCNEIQVERVCVHGQPPGDGYSLALMRTQVAIIGAGPAGLLLAHLLHQHGIESVVLEAKSRHYVENRVRAGVLEHQSVDVLNEAGVGARMMQEGLLHQGILLHFAGGSHRIDFEELTGRAVMIYGQQEVVKDLIAARLATSQPLYFEVDAVSIHDFDSDAPSVRFRLNGEERTLRCDFIAGCDGFHGICRATVPPERLTLFERVYPFAWLGILAEVPPASHELIYANSERGFALLSMRSPTISRLYLQCAPDEDLEQWSDERVWDELRARLNVPLTAGPVIQKSVTPMRSFVAEPMQFGRLFLAGDAAHIVPPTGAKGMNLAIADVHVLARAMQGFYRRPQGHPGRGHTRAAMEALDMYSKTCLTRIWKAQRFSWWMTSLLHRFDDHTPFDRRRQLAELEYIVSSRAAAQTLAENYVGLPLPPGP